MVSLNEKTRRHNNFLSKYCISSVQEVISLQVDPNLPRARGVMLKTVTEEPASTRFVQGFDEVIPVLG